MRRCRPSSPIWMRSTTAPGPGVCGPWRELGICGGCPCWSGPWPRILAPVCAGRRPGAWVASTPTASPPSSGRSWRSGFCPNSRPPAGMKSGSCATPWRWGWRAWNTGGNPLPPSASACWIPFNPWPIPRRKRRRWCGYGRGWHSTVWRPPRLLPVPDLLSPLSLPLLFSWCP